MALRGRSQMTLRCLSDTKIALNMTHICINPYAVLNPPPKAWRQSGTASNDCYEPCRACRVITWSKLFDKNEFVSCFIVNDNRNTVFDQC